MTCGRGWHIGILGYDLGHAFKGSSGTRIRDDIPKLDGYKKDLYQAKLEMALPTSDANTSFGDEMNALTDYYFDMAIGRPVSPPL